MSREGTNVHGELIFMTGIYQDFSVIFEGFIKENRLWSKLPTVNRIVKHFYSIFDNFIILIFIIYQPM